MTKELEPQLPFGARLTLTPGGRHELLTAYIVSANRSDAGWRYSCVFPFRSSVRWANVYSSEIETVGEVDEAETDRLLALDRATEVGR